MAFKMKGAPMQDTSSKHGTNANYKKSGAPGLLGKILDPLGLKKKLMGGNKNCPPPQGAQQAAAPAPDAPAQPAAPAPAAAAPAAPEEAAAPTMMKKGLKNGAPMKPSPAKGKMWDAIKKGDFKGAGKTLKHEIKGIGAGVKESLKDNYDTRSNANDIMSAYRTAKNKSAKKQKMKEGGKSWTPELKSNTSTSTAPNATQNMKNVKKMQNRKASIDKLNKENKNLKLKY